MDSKDVRILAMLKENARARFVDIARDVGMTEGAIRHRVRAMIANGTIKKFTIETSMKNVEALILIKTATGKTEKVLKKIRVLSDRVFELSGNYDIAVYLEENSSDELNKIVDGIRVLSGVLDTNTLVRLV
jgi:Lrp/AsnC family transcriptional regulator of lysine biosynthesis